MYNIFYSFIKYWIRTIVAAAIGLIFVIVYLTANNAWSFLPFYCDAFFIGGFVVLGIGILALCSSLGAFDVFTFVPGRKKKANGIKEDYYEYQNRKKENRSGASLTYIPYLGIGLLYIIVSFIFFFLR